MALDALKERADSKCELCSSTENLNTYNVPPANTISLDENRKPRYYGC